MVPRMGIHFFKGLFDLPYPFLGPKFSCRKFFSPCRQSDHHMYRVSWCAGLGKVQNPPHYPPALEFCLSYKSKVTTDHPTRLVLLFENVFTFSRYIFYEKRKITSDNPTRSIILVEFMVDVFHPTTNFQSRFRVRQSFAFTNSSEVTNDSE